MLFMPPGPLEIVIILHIRGLARHLLDIYHTFVMTATLPAITLLDFSPRTVNPETSLANANRVGYTREDKYFWIWEWLLSLFANHIEALSPKFLHAAHMEEQNSA